jgi:hypothetical protein
MESLSKFVGHSLIPAVHPTAEDMAMGAVDFMAEYPLANSTLLPSANYSSVYPTPVPFNATVGQKILDAVRVVVPTVVDFVAPSNTHTPPIAFGTVPPVVDHGVESVLPVDVHVDLYPQVISKVYQFKLMNSLRSF